MQDKQKVTLYLSQELHRRLKIRSAIDLEPMSDLAERAIGFYLAHPEVVEEKEVHGRSHRVYDCPECESTLALREGDLVSLRNQPGILSHQESISVDTVRMHASSNASGEEEISDLLRSKFPETAPV
jgi:hypothetical protein